MKYVITTIVILLIANIKMVKDEEEKRVWEVVWNYLRSIAGGLQLHPDTGLSIYQFLEKYNYTLESHDVITEDGYILTVHRIPYARYDSNKQNNKKGTPILLVHCLACSSMDWVWQGPKTSLALLLADSGYDVWLANTRGNAHSLRHKTRTSADPSFWDFSFHEKGYYDIPATIDYILNNTQLDKLSYIGHSQGTSNALVLTSTRVEYNDKFNLMVLLSPIVYMKHSCSPSVLLVGKYINLAKMILKYFDIYGLTYNPYITILTDIFCNEQSLLQGLCVIFIDTFSGYDPDQIDKEKLTVFLSNTPSGLSIKDIEHYIQGIDSGMFRQFDYGSSASNLMHYKQVDPPSYDIGKLKAPVAVYYAKNDFLSTKLDVERLLSELNTDIVDQYLIENELFNHLDFITAKNVKTLIYDRVLEVVLQKNPLHISSREDL